VGVIIDPDSPVYPYQQLAANLRDRIAAGEITGPLPSYTTLCADTGLSLGTVQRAVQLLVDEGLVIAVRGRGVFVRHDR
jgi:GntR family transcriptional regulator